MKPMTSREAETKYGSRELKPGEKFARLERALKGKFSRWKKGERVKVMKSGRGLGQEGNAGHRPFPFDRADNEAGREASGDVHLPGVEPLVVAC